MLPPSLHKSGGRYEVVRDAEPAPLPEGLLEFIEMKAAEADGALPGTRTCLVLDELGLGNPREVADRLFGAEISHNLECNGVFRNAEGKALDAEGTKVHGSVMLRKDFVAEGTDFLAEAWKLPAWL